MLKRKILLVLIHNKNPRRYKLISPNLKKMQSRLSKNYHVELTEVSHQPRLRPASVSLTIYRRFVYWYVNRQWLSYKRMSKNILLDMLLLIRRIFITLADLKNEQLKASAEMLSSDKHTKSWQLLINKNMDLLITFEDDAIFDNNSIKKVEDIIKQIKDVNRPVVINLGEGNPPEINQVQNIIGRHAGSNQYYKKPALNTACCYLINLKTGIIFTDFIMANPLYRILAGDWLTNKIFMASADINNYLCFHSEPPIFGHGSIKGKFRSEISQHL